jgi:type II secretory pathway component PulM
MMMTVVGGVLILLVLAWTLVVKPIGEYQDRLDRRIASSENRLEEIAALARAVRSQTIGASAASAPGRPEGFTLFAFVEGVASQSGVRGAIEFMRPSSRPAGAGLVEEQVELRIRQIMLDKLMAYLYALETAGEGVRVKRLAVRRAGEALDVDLIVSTMTTPT